ncbi:MAG: site-specific integrase [Oscillospiraceae bacterium]|nr:site-specific integrase [Oscillospiraceae bacterium]
MTVEQQELFIDYIYASEKYNRMANLFTVLLGTGMRIGEALGLRWCDCDFEEDIIHVTHALLYKQGEDGNYRYRVSAPKTEADFREIPMFDEVKAVLQWEREKRHTVRNNLL